MCLDYHFHETQSKTDARLHHVGIGVAAIEFRPHLRLFFGRYSDAIVGYRDGNLAFCRILASDGDIHDVARILHGILQQVADHILQLFPITSHLVGASLIAERNIHLLLLVLLEYIGEMRKHSANIEL